MKHYEKLVGLGCFSRSELAGMLGCDATAASTIREYLRKGYVERVRHDLYAVISLETKQPVCSRYKIGASLFPDACISHHSALELYGYANQVFYETYVATTSRFPDFEYNGVSYHRVAQKTDAHIVQIGGVHATDLERTVVDSIADLEKIGGLEETLRCFSLIPSLDHAKLLDVLALYRNGFLYQKCGYIFEALNSSLGLPDSFFSECRKHISNSKRYLMKSRDGIVWHDKWKLYAPDSIQHIINKGVSDYDAI